MRLNKYNNENDIKNADNFKSFISQKGNDIRLKTENQE